MECKNKSVLYKSSNGCSKASGRVIPFPGKRSLCGVLISLLLAPGYASAATIVGAGEEQIVNSGDIVDGSIIQGDDWQNVGKQIVNNGGLASNTTINFSGEQYIYSGGSASNAVVNSSGTQYVRSGGSASDTTLNDGGRQYIDGGSASNTIINTGGTQILRAGSVTTATTVNAGGNLLMDPNSTATDIVLSAGAIFITGTFSTASGIHSQGTFSIDAATRTANNVMLENTGYLQVYNGGTSINTILNSRGEQNIHTGGFASATIVNRGGKDNVNGGSASAATLNAGGQQTVNAGGIASNTTINGGYQLINNSGSASATTVNLGGDQMVNSGGSASGTTVNSGGQQNVSSGGFASNTTVNSGGWQIVHSNGTINTTTINSGGSLVVSAGGIAVDVAQASGAALLVQIDATVSGTNSLGSFSIDAATRSANNVLLENGGLLNVLSGSLASNTTVNSGGTLNVLQDGIINGHTAINDGGVLAAAIINNEGLLTFNPTSTDMRWSGELSGAGSVEKRGSGTLTLSGILSQAGMSLEEGTLVMQNMQAVTDIIGQTGTTLKLENSLLTGTIDPLDMAIDEHSTWNNTGSSLLDTLTHAGTINFIDPVGQYLPSTLTVHNLDGQGGTIILNTELSNSQSLTDRLVIDSGQATGTTYLSVRNQGGLGDLTTGDGINVVSAINGAQTWNAFKLKGSVEAGAYEYTLRKGLQNESWYLTTDIPDSAPPDDSSSSGGSSENGQSGESHPGTVRPDTIGKPNYRAAMALYSSVYAQMMDYDTQVAGSRDSRMYKGLNGTNSASWGRLQAGNLRHSNGGFVTDGNTPDSSTSYTFLQVGLDLLQLSSPSMTWTGGIYAASGLSHSTVTRQNNSKAGEIRDTAYTGGLYLTAIHEQGWWTDLVIQGTRHNVKSDPVNSHNLASHGPGYLASLESGLPLALGDKFVLEPQIQYIYRTAELNDASDGVSEVKFGQGKSQQARAGLRFSNHRSMLKETREVPVTWWIRPSVTQTFGTDTTLKVSASGMPGSEVAFRPTQNGTAVSLDVGIDGQIRNNVTLGVRASFAEPLHGGAVGGYNGQVNLKVEF